MTPSGIPSRKPVSTRCLPPRGVVMFLNSYRRRLRSEALMRGVVSRVDQTYVAPFLGAKVIREEDWRAVFTTARSEERICGWSPDSRLLYFLLERDGFRCL